MDVHYAMKELQKHTVIFAQQVKFAQIAIGFVIVANKRYVFHAYMNVKSATYICANIVLVNTNVEKVRKLIKLIYSDA